MPISFFEGIPEDQQDRGGDRASQRRLLELAAAVREHEAASRRARPASRARDERLYRRMRQIAGEQAGRSRAKIPAG